MIEWKNCRQFLHYRFKRLLLQQKLRKINKINDINYFNVVLQRKCETNHINWLDDQIMCQFLTSPDYKLLINEVINEILIPQKIKEINLLLNGPKPTVTIPEHLLLSSNTKLPLSAKSSKAHLSGNNKIEDSSSNLSVSGLHNCNSSNSLTNITNTISSPLSLNSQNSDSENCLLLNSKLIDPSIKSNQTLNSNLIHAVSNSDKANILFEIFKSLNAESQNTFLTTLKYNNQTSNLFSQFEEDNQGSVALSKRMKHDSGNMKLPMMSSSESMISQINQMNLLVNHEME